MRNNFEIEEEDVVLGGTSGEKIAFQKIRFEDEGIIIIQVLLLMDWMKATVQAETSEIALLQLETDLKRMIEREISHFKFVSMTGNVSIECGLFTLGTIEVSGGFSHSDANVEFSFRTDLTYLPALQKGLSSFLY